MTLLRPAVPDHPDRRQFLRLGAASLLFSGAGCATTEESASVPNTQEGLTSARTIDVHCHIFNARDLPIRNFVRIIVFEGRPAGVALDPLVAFLSFIMDQQSPTAADELAAIAT